MTETHHHHELASQTMICDGTGPCRLQACPWLMRPMCSSIKYPYSPREVHTLLLKNWLVRPPPPRNFHWPSMGWVCFFSETAQCGTGRPGLSGCRWSSGLGLVLKPCSSSSSRFCPWGWPCGCFWRRRQPGGWCVTRPRGRLIGWTTDSGQDDSLCAHLSGWPVPDSNTVRVYTNSMVHVHATFLCTFCTRMLQHYTIPVPVDSFSTRMKDNPSNFIVSEIFRQQMREEISCISVRTIPSSD